MKREILFKAKRSDGKGWVEGFFVKHQNITGIIPLEDIFYTK